jgi:two-component system, sensor histidine kinase and response regulator
LKHRPTILLVDDMPPVLEALAALLETEGCNIMTANDGLEALDSIAQSPPDVILLDVMMPRMDGFEVAKRLKADKRWRHIPIVLVTALDSTADLVRALEAGADEFLSKPVNGVELRARVRSMLRIKRQYDELEASLRLREDLANMVAHDMRTPLTIILGSTEDLAHAETLPPDQRATFEALRTQAKRLNAYLMDLLLSAKMEAGELSLNLATLDVCELAREAESNYRQLVALRGRSLALDLPAEACQANLDSRLFSRVLDNLLSNALKFSPPGGAIALQVVLDSADAERLWVRVKDQGPGIPPEHRQGIFDKFQIVDLKQQGLTQIGLGLAFSKLVVEAHGGRIFVEENSPQGAVFVVELQRARAAEGPALVAG